MWPSPSCGSPPNWRGARRKLWTLDLDDDRVAGLAGAVAGGDDRRRWARPGTAAALACGVFESLPPPSASTAPATTAVAASAAEVAVPSPHRSGNITRNFRNRIRRAASTRDPRIALRRSLALVAPARRGAGLADHVDVFAGTRPGPRHLRRRPQLPRRRRCPSGWSSGAPTRPRRRRTRGGYDYRDYHISRLQPHPPQRRRLRPLRRLPLPADDRAARRLAGGAGGRRSTASFQPGFSHADESGRPGLLLGPPQPGRAAARSTSR